MLKQTSIVAANTIFEPEVEKGTGFNSCLGLLPTSPSYQG